MPPVTPGSHARRTPGRTPGRRQHKDDYLKFNARPKEVGSRTGRPMPTNVPLNEEGFEDADEFFRSSPQSGPSSSRLQTPAGRRGDGSSPSTVRTNRSRRSRMSDMVADEDDEAFAENLLADEDDDDLGGTPRLHFPSSPNPPPSAIVPRMHRLPPKSPSVGFDAIPSPSMSITARRSTIGVNYRPLEPRLSPTTPLRNDISGLHSPPALEGDDDDMDQGMEVDISAEFEEDVVEEISFERRPIEEDVPEDKEEDDEEQVNEPQTPGATNSGKVRDPGLRTSVHGKSKGPIPRDEDEEDDEEQDASNSRSFQEPAYDDGADPSGVADTYDDYSDAGGPEGGFEVNDQDDVPAEDDSNYDIDNTVNNIDNTIDNTMDNIDDTVDDIDQTVDNTVDTVDSADITGVMDDVEDEEGDLSLERRAIEEEQMDDEEAGDVTAISQDRTPKPKSRTKKTKAASTPRSPAELPKPKRSRISQLPDKTDNNYTGDFKTRRSGRQHMRPLEWWRGERVEYARGEYQAVIKSVVHIPPEPKKPPRVKPRGGARARTGRSASRSVRARSESVPVEEGWDDSTKENALVCEYPSGREVSRRVALPRSRVNPKTVVGPDFEFQYEKIFGEEKFIASGIVEIPVGGSKPAKPSRDNAYVFYVIAGAVRVELHRTSFVMAVGGQFLIPRGNAYAIENVSPTTKAKLFFAQARKITASEAEEAEVQERAAQHMLSQSQRSLGAVEEEGSEEEEGSQEESSDDDDRVLRLPQRRSVVA